MKKITLKEYDVNIVSNETRYHNIKAHSAKEAAEIMSKIISQTTLILAGKMCDCDTKIDISVSGVNIDCKTGKREKYKLRMSHDYDSLDIIKCLDYKITVPEEGLFMRADSMSSDTNI